MGIVIDKTLIVNDDTFQMMTRTSRCDHQRAWEEDEGSGMINDLVPLGHLSIPSLTSSSPHPSCRLWDRFPQSILCPSLNLWVSNLLTNNYTKDNRWLYNFSLTFARLVTHPMTSPVVILFIYLQGNSPFFGVYVLLCPPDTHHMLTFAHLHSDLPLWWKYYKRGTVLTIQMKIGGALPKSIYYHVD